MRWFRRRQCEQDLERELRSDLELEAEEHLENGLSPEQARYAARRAVGTIAVVALTSAVKQGDSLFTGTPGGRPGGTTIEQGYLEGSGVEPARAMVDMIVSLRAYEASQRVLRTIDDTLGKAVTSVGSASG